MRPSEEDVKIAEEAADEEVPGTEPEDITAEQGQSPAEESGEVPEETAEDEVSEQQKAADAALEDKRRATAEQEGMTEDGMFEEIEEESVIRDSIADVTQGFVNKAANVLYSFIDVFVGICFVLMAAMTIVTNKTHGISYEDMGVTGWVSYLVMLFGGSILVFNPRRTFNTSIGLYAIVMGTVSFCKTWETLEVSSGDLGIFGFIYDAMFIAQMILLALSINLMVSGTSYLRGRPRGTLGMMTKAMLLLAINLFNIVAGVRLGIYNDLADALREDPVMTVQIFLFFIFLNVLDSDEARSYNTKNRLSDSTEALRHTKTLDGKSYILLKDAVALNSKTFEGWYRPRDGGPVELEYRFAIHTTGGASYVTVQRWRGKDAYYLTITDHERGTNIRATRMSVDTMYMTDDATFFRIVGHDHFYINMHVRHPLDEYHIGVGGKE